MGGAESAGCEALEELGTLVLLDGALPGFGDTFDDAEPEKIQRHNTGDSVA